jgi:hypothetical protein
LIALGDRRTGQWSIGVATALVIMVVSNWLFAANGIQSGRFLSVVIGTIGGLITGLFMSNRAAAIKASTDAYPEQVQEIRERCCEAWGRLGSIEPSVAKESIRRSLTHLESELERDGPQWLDGAGYLEAWSHLHDAEENLLLIDLSTNVAAAGMNDLLRLHNSRIAARPRLVDEIKEAIPHLSPIAGSSLTPYVPQPNPCDPDTAKQRIKNVRAAINEDREGKWRQVVKARNGLGLGVLAAAMITYLVVAVAIAIGVSSRALAAAAVFFAVGAAVSAAHQLAARSRNQSEVEDFGYANVKLLVGPSLSGLVAVLSVAALARANVNLFGHTFGGSFESWQATFDWTRNPDAIWIALVFGLTPSLLFAFLQGRVNGALDSLKSSQPSGGKGK